MNTTTINPQDIKFTTRFRKGFRGNEATTDIDFKDGKRVKILTMKRSNGYYVTTAQFVNVQDQGNCEIETFIVFQDFNSCLKTHKEIKRGTEKAITQAHEDSIKEYLPTVLEALEKQYGTIELK